MPEFLEARKYEIKQLGNAMHNSKTAAKQRAFQSLPRELRRRTASHNVKRIPHRLRDRATKEMVDDNTPPVPPKSKKLRGYLRVKQKAMEQNLKKSKKEQQKNISESSGVSGNQEDQFDLDKYIAPTARFNTSSTNGLAIPPPGKTKYQHRQRNKTWLPTHVWHAKRAHISEKWGFSIVTSPSLKCYRATHRSSTRTGAVAWDSSYYSSFILQGPQNILETVLKRLTQNKFSDRNYNVKRIFSYNDVIKGNRSWEGMLYDFNGGSLSPLLLVWEKLEEGNVENSQPEASQIPNRKVLLRCHPSVSLRLVDSLNFIRTEVNSAFDYHDYRYLLGSIDITGPESSSALASVLKIKPNNDIPAHSSATDEPSDSTQSLDPLKELGKMWNRLGNISNISSLPRNVILALNAADPRLSFPPRYTRDDCKYSFIDMISNWPNDIFVNPRVTKNGSVFSETDINNSYVNQPTQKSIDKRRAQSTDAGINHDKIPYLPEDPTFPVLIIKRETGDSWTVILPWGWILPVWYSLQHHNNVRIGGLDQRHQLDFEAGRLNFPTDFPGTLPGLLDNEEKAEATRLEWARKPPGKKISYRNLRAQGKGNEKGEIGSPFRCDWKYLWKLHVEPNVSFPQDPQDIETEFKTDLSLQKAILAESKKHTGKLTAANARSYIKEENSTLDTNGEQTTADNSGTSLNDQLEKSKETNNTEDSENENANSATNELIATEIAQESKDSNKNFIKKVLKREIQNLPHHYVTFSPVDNTISNSASQDDTTTRITSNTDSSGEDKQSDPEKCKPLLLKPIRLQYINRGTPQRNARIYRIPPESRGEWLQLLKNNKRNGSRNPESHGLSMHKDRTKVTTMNNENIPVSSKEGDLAPQNKLNDNYPDCPSKEYLIGYVTTGSFNLKAACGTGVGAVIATALENQKYFLVRNVGSTITRLAKFEEISLV